MINMENTIEEPKVKTEFDGFGDDLFSIIPGIEHAGEVPVVNASELTKEIFYKNWVSYNKPCLVKGAVKNWPAVQKFKDPDYWLSVCDDFEIKIFPHMNHIDRERLLKDSEDISFHDAIKRLHRNEDYIFSIPAETITEDNKFSKLIKEIPGFSFLSSTIKPRGFAHRRFFMYRRASTAWHHHLIDETLMCQINGTKKVVLLPPDMPNVKKVTEFFIEELNLSGKTLDNIDLKPIIACVEEGDALYIPPYWHHAVIPVDGEVGFTYAHCWKSPLHKFGDFSNYFVRRFYFGGLWPIKGISLVMPVLGVCSGISFGFRKMVNVFK